METLRLIKSSVPLDMMQKVVRFMDELKEYELWVTDNQFDSQLPEPVSGSTMLLHKPYVDPSRPYREIREFVWVIGLDNRLHAIYIDLISIGDFNTAKVPHGMVFRGTALYGASSIILVHNHPTGNPSPSENDVKLTKKILQIGLMLGRPLYNHVILGQQQHYGFTDDDSEWGLASLQELVQKEQQEKEELVATILQTRKEKEELELQSRKEKEELMAQNKQEKEELEKTLALYKKIAEGKDKQVKHLAQKLNTFKHQLGEMEGNSND